MFVGSACDQDSGEAGVQNIYTVTTKHPKDVYMCKLDIDVYNTL